MRALHFSIFADDRFGATNCNLFSMFYTIIHNYNSRKESTRGGTVLFLSTPGAPDFSQPFKNGWFALEKSKNGFESNKPLYMKMFMQCQMKFYLDFI